MYISFVPASGAPVVPLSLSLFLFNCGKRVNLFWVMLHTDYLLYTVETVRSKDDWDFRMVELVYVYMSACVDLCVDRHRSHSCAN